MIEPLLLRFEVGCSVEHAFRTWTSAIGTWWPRDHSVTREDDLEVVLQPEVGGRIFERTVTGVEHDWGEITVWEPPQRLGYRWFLGSTPERATDVDVRFLPRPAERTEVVIEHTGWQRLGDGALDLRDRNTLGWQTLIPHFEAAVTEGEH
jgi:hypothetical protein